MSSYHDCPYSITGFYSCTFRTVSDCSHDNDVGLVCYECEFTIGYYFLSSGTCTKRIYQMKKKLFLVIVKIISSYSTGLQRAIATSRYTGKTESDNSFKCSSQSQHFPYFVVANILIGEQAKEEEVATGHFLLCCQKMYQIAPTPSMQGAGDSDKRCTYHV